MRAPILILAMLCAACGGKPPPEMPIIYRDGPSVEVPKPVACKPKVDPRPDYPDTNEALRAADHDLDKQVGLLLASRKLRTPYEDEIEKALHDCAMGKAP